MDKPSMFNSIQGMRVLVTGAGGQLGRTLKNTLTGAGATVVGVGRRPSEGVDVVADVANADSIKRAILDAAPEGIIHAAAYVDVEGCEREPERAMAINAAGTRHVAEAARNTGAHLIMISTDFVFSGDQGAPYAEMTPPRPTLQYGRSKLAGERETLEVDTSFAVARTAWLFGGFGKHFPRVVVSVIRDRGSISVVTDEVGCPTSIEDLADALVLLMARRGAGIFHLVNEGSTSRFTLACAVAHLVGLPEDLVRPITTAEFLAAHPSVVPRPPNSALMNVRAAELGIRLRPWYDALSAYAPRLANEFQLADGRGFRRMEGAQRS